MLKTITRKVSHSILKGLQYESGLFGASRSSVSTGYNQAWIRDNIYESLGLEYVGDYDSIIKAFHALLDALKKHEYKIDWAIKEKPDERYKYIHARVCPITFDEIEGEWGNKQNDSIGALLFKIGDLLDKDLDVMRNLDDQRLIQKLVFYLQSVEYWHDKDNGIWEENEEVHASSVGACVAGLKKISKYVHVPTQLIAKGQEVLDELLPRESETKEVDLALLTLIYPFDVVSEEQRFLILKNVEENLVRMNGVIRYQDDQYYSNGKEAEWTMGFPWLAKIYKDLGDVEKHRHYLKKTYSVMTWKGELPELYYGGTKNPNENTPLGWSQALHLCAL